MEPEFRRSRNFLFLRLGQFVADLGGNLSAVAMPAMIILALQATPFQIGALEAIATGMIPLTAAVAGVVADRVRGRRLLIFANLVRIVAIACIPVAYVTGFTPIWLFFVIAAVTASASSFFDAAYATFVPLVVGERQIGAGTAQLAVGMSVAEAAGTGLGGALVALVGAPVVVLLNAATFVFSTLMIAITRVHVVPAAPCAPTSFLGDARDGVRAIFAHAVLRSVTLSNAVAHFGGGMAAAVGTAFIYRNLHLSPETLGIVLGCANAGALAAWHAASIAQRIGLRRTFAGAHVVSALGNAVLPLLAGLFPLVGLAASRLLLTASGPVFAVNDTTVRLSVVAPELRGRATATARTIVWSALPAGSLIGGACGSLFGLSQTMIAGAVITAAAAAIVHWPRSRWTHFVLSPASPGLSKRTSFGHAR